MRLVDREQRHPRSLDRLPKPFILEALRRHVEQPQFALANSPHHFSVLVGRERRVEFGGRDSAACQDVDLVFHQGDQWRDHDRQAVQQQLW